MPCKRSSAAPIPFGFQLSVARSRRFALPVTARSAPCGFVPLRQSRRNTVLRTPSHIPGGGFYLQERAAVDTVHAAVVISTGCDALISASTAKKQTALAILTVALACGFGAPACGSCGSGQLLRLRRLTGLTACGFGSLRTACRKSRYSCNEKTALKSTKRSFQGCQQLLRECG